MPRIEDMIENGEFDIRLNVINPAETGSIGGDGVIGKALDNSRWIKTGDNATDWEQLLTNATGIIESVENLVNFSSSLDATFTTDSELAAVSNSLVSTITTDSSSFETRVSDLEDYTILQIVADPDDKILSISDINSYVRLTNETSTTVTVPANSVVNWSSVTPPPTIYFRVVNNPTVTLSPGTVDVTINDPQNISGSLSAGSTFALQWVATNEWDVI